MNRTAFLAALSAGLALALAACAPAAQGPLPDPAAYRIAPADLSAPLPEIGPVGVWMVTKNLENATWLGEKVGGRTLREPINVVLLDKVASSAEQAVARLMDAMTAAGYGPKNMHSDGYYGFIGERLYAQHPVSGQGLAFSDAPWWRTNHHGRIFGPARVAGGYVFTGAFSLEDMKWLPRPRHTYNSIQTTRENLADRLNAATTYQRAGYVDLGNRLDTPTETTGDHDGRAVLLVAAR